MALDSTVSGGIIDGEYHLRADGEVDDLRRALWRAIHANKGNLPRADIALALGVVQYELLHHADEPLD